MRGESWWPAPRLPRQSNTIWSGVTTAGSRAQSGNQFHRLVTGVAMLLLKPAMPDRSRPDLSPRATLEAEPLVS